jgi:Ca-activated chloride channel family protein
MSPTHAVLAGGLAALAVAGGATGAAQEQFRAAVAVVRLPVVVTDREGEPVRGLRRADFDVWEDGKPQEIAFFAEGPPGETLPLYLGLLLDTSGSMERDLRQAANAAVRFVTALDEATDVTLVDFDSAVRLGRFSPPSYPHLFERIRTQQTGGRTALYDAVGVYLSRSIARRGQHILVLYTDGGDTASSITFGRLQHLLRMTDVLVYAIGYLEHQPSSARLRQQMRITQIADETGGEAYFPSSGSRLDDVYARILRNVAARYTIGYVPLEPPEDGEYRRIDVRVTRPDLDKIKIRTRSGYMRLESASRENRRP